MTITFHCPECKGLCAFDDKYAGRQARCTKCQTHFYIPQKDGEKAKRIKIEYYNDGDVMSGFYKAVFVKSWGIFTDKKNIVGLVLISAAVVFNFILGNRNFVLSAYIRATGDVAELPIPFGTVCEIFCWGIITSYYLKIINSAAFEVDALPENDERSFFQLSTKAIKSVYYFFVTAMVIFAPSIILLIIQGFTEVDLQWAVYISAVLSGFWFPMAILNIAVSEDVFLLWRLDKIVMPFFKIPLPYLTVVVLFVISAGLEILTQNYNRDMFGEFGFIGLNLAGKILAQIPTLICMRSIGLLYRHYGGYLL